MGYLLCALLAVAALHASVLASNSRSRSRRKDRFALSKKWMAVAARYHALTVEGFRIAIQKHAAETLGFEGGGLAWEDIKQGFEFFLVSPEACSASDRGKAAPVLVNPKWSSAEEKKGEEKKGWAGQGEGMGRDRVSVVHTKAAMKKFSQLDKVHVDEFEAMLLATTFLTMYGMATGILDSETLSFNSSSTTSSSRPSATLQRAAATTCTTNTSPSVATLSTASAPLQRSLSWVPLLRGTPTMIQQFPHGWVIFSQGNFSVFSAGHTKRLAPGHPYESKLTHLHHTLFTPAYIPHPKLPQPQCSMAADTFEKVMQRLIHCFARFFGGEDFLAAAMSFPAAVEEEFYMALGVALVAGKGGDARGGHACDGSGGAHEATTAEGRQGSKDPRVLVIMAYALVLLVLVVEMFPDYGKEVQVGEDFCGVLGVREESDSGAEGEFESGLDDWVRTAEGVKHCRSPAGWWVDGLGECGITGIAQYLSALDEEEERCSDGMEVRVVKGRWMRWMEWPLEVSRNGGQDVMGVLKEAAYRANQTTAHHGW